MPQLDSLRALAFFGVAASHWLHRDFRPAVVGGTAVHLFFVLSGFLITGILLDYRCVQRSNPSVSAASGLRTFFMRRFLRIFPLFYAVIIGAAILNVGPMREVWGWHAGYASNFLYAFHGSSAGDPFTHFWTLAVEEQFYLVWPFLICFLPIKTIKWLIVALVVAAPFFRIGIEIAFPAVHRANYLPISCGDSLGVGAFLAFASRNQTLVTWSPLAIARGMLYSGLGGGIVVAILISILGRSLWLHSIGHTCLVLVFGWVVFGAAKGFGGPLGFLLERPVLRFLGQISYGLYVFHHFATDLPFRTIMESVRLPSDWGNRIEVQLLLRVTFTVTLATASWFLLEKPLNNLKRHFSIPGPRQREVQLNCATTREM